MTYALGVDLGTTYTAAAVARPDPHAALPRVETVTLGNHDAAIPSVVYWSRAGEVLVGEPAARRALTNPGSTVREFKRRFGDSTSIYLDGVPRTPQGLTATLLRWVVDRVTEREGGAPGQVCVTCPANWGEYRRELLQQAVAHVGLEHATYVTEPEAAALRYASAERIEPGGTVGVYDLGGGTFDAAVVRRTDTGFELVGRPTGIERLGGVDVDDIVFQHVLRSLGADAPDEDAVDDPVVAAAVLALRRECVEAKESLSEDTETLVHVNLPGVQRVVRLTRGELEELVRPLILETVTSFRRALDAAGVRPEGLTAVLLAGGASRMPIVAQTLSGELGRPVAIDAHPKQVVATGAALWAALDGALPVPAPPDTARVAAVPAARRAETSARAAEPVVRPASRPAARPVTSPSAPPAAATPAAPAKAPDADRRATSPRSTDPAPLREELAGRIEPPPPTGWRGALRRVTGQPDAVLLGASAACLAGLLLVAAIGVPHNVPETLTVTQNGQIPVDLGQDTLQVSDGNPQQVSEGKAPVLVAPVITPKLFNAPFDVSASVGGYASLSRLQPLLAGDVLADVSGSKVVTDKQGRRTTTRVAAQTVLHVDGSIVSVPGIAGLAIVLFAAAYAESLLRGVRRRRRARATTLAGMALVGAVLGVGAALAGWTLGDHLLSLPYLLVAALLGNAAALALTVVLSRRDQPAS
jgi:actin-like ATPase involved in cell morphogenesis